jgi:16S rRNA (cytosine967-C5)-methyltransferase
LFISQQLAASAIHEVFSGRNLNVSLSHLFETHPHLSVQQKAVAQDLSYGVLRVYSKLQAILDSLIDKPLKDEWLRFLLLVALYQLLLNKGQPFTIVNQAVKSVSRKQPAAKGLVNAVLRNFLRRSDEIIQHLPHSDTIRFSYPTWWIRKLKQDYPDDWETLLEIGNTHPPMTLRVNLRKISVDDYLNKLEASQIPFVFLGDQALRLEKPMPVDKIPGFNEGEVSVQDYSAQLAGFLMDLQDGQFVLDACSAPGGKTGQILEMAHVNLLAMDIDETRLIRTKANLERLGLNAQIAVGDAAASERWWKGQPFDRIIADVPCTASGIVRRHVDIKWLRREADIQSFNQQQKAILKSLWNILAKGGKLLYVTCSIFPEENQQIIDWFLADGSDRRQLPLPVLISDVAFNQGQIKPHANHDGLFYALLEKL